LIAGFTVAVKKFEKIYWSFLQVKHFQYFKFGYFINYVTCCYINWLLLWF